ncbi:hypothetical protein ROLI_040140 [Roseobacter fucihabitans]|uniref:DUF3726 domain-containing protein n=1 Tax=Roseobacter fucihabitans TaxID=1537242 RepID=A0ABZ2BY29_9RHOB|nr:DUF3726 domain-containing protein [Roseobacter litoralis]MBC6964883.1 hypothetical protein [Roseobacter litoralis]
MSVQPHDQTRGESMPVFNDQRSAPLSCSEVAALCMKAARGAGMSWGMAEEAGFAAAWLVSHDVDGPSHLRAHLERVDGRSWSDLCPSITPGIWQNTAGQAACPIILGATMCDYANLPEGPTAGAIVKLGKVSAPILLVPFLASIAQDDHLAITLSWDGGAFCLEQCEANIRTAEKALCAPDLELTLTAKAATPSHAPVALTRKANISAETIIALNTLAMRTTVPASDASRAGAGSALSDND